MTVDKAIKKAFSHFRKAGFKRKDIAVMGLTSIYEVALLYMIEDLTRIISSNSRSASLVRAK